MRAGVGTSINIAGKTNRPSGIVILTRNTLLTIVLMIPRDAPRLQTMPAAGGRWA
jgi:hypothetical protein